MSRGQCRSKVKGAWATLSVEAWPGMVLTQAPGRGVRRLGISPRGSCTALAWDARSAGRPTADGFSKDATWRNQLEAGKHPKMGSQPQVGDRPWGPPFLMPVSSGSRFCLQVSGLGLLAGTAAADVDVMEAARSAGRT